MTRTEEFAPRSGGREKLGRKSKGEAKEMKSTPHQLANAERGLEKGLLR